MVLSSATEHVCSQKEKLTDLIPLKCKVEIANSEKTEVAGIGDILLKPALEYGDQMIFLWNVLYVPEHDSNLLSAERIKEMGITIFFQNG